MEPSVGCEVVPEKASIAASTASTPASAAARIVRGRRRGVMRVEVDRQPTSSRSARISTRAAERLEEPRHVLEAQTWRPPASSSLAMAT
jgi:hypothetical protein